MEVLQWNCLAPAVQVKLLFLLDIGDMTSHDIDHQDDLTSAPTKARDAFLSVLQDRQHRFVCVTDILKARVKHLQEYPFISLAAGTLANDLSVRKDDEDLLTLVHVCRHLGVECSHLEEKTKNVQKKLSLTEEEIEGNLLIYAENLRMLRLCDALTDRQVMQLFGLTVENNVLNEFVDTHLKVSADKLEQTKGLKEALFFYLIRTLELNNKLNRIYTSKLKALLEKLQSQTESDAERRVLSEAISSMDDYPAGERPAGLCVVFCVTRGRKGAEAEIEKVKHAFGKSLGYTVQIEENPDKEKLEECLRLLRKPKYKYYDSIVYWFMSHGSEETMELADGYRIERKAIIHEFSILDHFRKKPKIFFMTQCQGNSTIRLRRKRSAMLVTMDSHFKGNVSYSEVTEDHLNITAVYYQMDRLVASATLPRQYAFRHPDGGSMYVDIVCRLMEQHRGHNITQVLERVTNTMHQILFSCKNKFDGEAKQACCYESTLQKTFRVP
ncbi:hypothetical protein O3P69_000178 [Scylla paramamosain]